MMSTKHYFSFIFCFSFVLSFVVTAPVPSSDDPLAKFVEFLKQNNCSMPTAVVLPFSGTDSSPFGYLSTPLKECRSPEAVLESSEPNLLCRETFDVLQNITCNDFSGLPKIDGSHLSSNVCKDFAAVQDILPKQNDYLSGKLWDGVVCKVLCTGRYELLCKTLLWSYDIQATIKKATISKPKETLTENKNLIPNESDPSVKTTEENGEEDHQEVNEIADKTKDAQPDPAYSEEVSPKSPSNDEIPQTVALSNSSKDGAVNISQAIQNVPSSTQKSIPTSEVLEKNVHKEEKGGEVSSSTPEKVSHATPEKVDNESTGASNASSVLVNESNAKSSTTNAKSSTTNAKSSSTNAKSGTTNAKSGTTNAKSGTTDAKSGTTDAKSSTTEVKPNENPDLPIVPETEIESGVNNGGLQEPSEIETDVKKKIDVVTDSISSTDMEPHPDVKDPELYNNAFSVKKDPEVKSVDPNPISSNSVVRETYLSGRNYLPEPEDSHFFFYFLSIVLILMAGYLVFHNKQKIIALIVEGRHERRRRSHGAGYKKLETK